MKKQRMYKVRTKINIVSRKMSKSEAKKLQSKIRRRNLKAVVTIIPG